jgi:hypothetical protein
VYEWKVERCAGATNELPGELQQILNGLEANGYEIFVVEMGIPQPMVVARKERKPRE